jgi:hypothetical protein
MVNFFDLSESSDDIAHVSFVIITEVLAQIFNVDQITKDTIYRYDTKLETQNNHQKILKCWKWLFFGQKNIKTTSKK